MPAKIPGPVTKSGKPRSSKGFFSYEEVGRRRQKDDYEKIISRGRESKKLGCKPNGRGRSLDIEAATQDGKREEQRAASKLRNLDVQLGEVG